MSSQVANIRECLACEQPFDPTDFILQQVTDQFKDQYCSKSCQDSYEEYLALSAATYLAQNIEPKPTQNNSGIDALIAQFRKREQK